LTARQLELIKQDMLKEVEFVEGKRASYNKTTHDIVVSLCFMNATNKVIAQRLGISLQQLIKWRTRYPDLCTDMDNARANLIEDAHLELVQGKHYKEGTKKYSYIKDADTGKRKRVLVEESEQEKYLAPNIKSLDRLAQKYAPELADKERKQLDANITFIIDTGIGNSSPVTVDAQATEITGEEGDSIEEDALDFL
jgi:hypothetical protein